MKSSTFAAPLLAAGLLFGSGMAAFAQGCRISTPAPSRPLIEVSIDCTSSPERVTATNNTARPLKLTSVGSLYAKRAGEPYKMKKTLKPGKSVSYTFGSGEGEGKRLSGSYIFDNEAAKEGVLVKTSKGNVKVRCSEGTNAPQPEVAPVVPVTEPIIGQPVDALELLATLPVQPEVDEGYERVLFEHWVDADGDGCDTRQEVLIAQSLRHQ